MEIQTPKTAENVIEESIASNNMSTNNTAKIVTTHCLNCGTDFEGKYCPECGQKAATKRLSFFKQVFDQRIVVVSVWDKINNDAKNCFFACI